jgi:hypothetical protein
MGAAEIQIRKEGSVGQTHAGKDVGILHKNENNTDTRIVCQCQSAVRTAK